MHFQHIRPSGLGADTARRQPGHGRGREVSVLPGLLLEVVGIEDAARAMVLAAERGRVGERYIISDRFMSYKEINEIAAEAAGVRPPRIKLTLPLLYAAAHGNDLGARLLKRDLMFAAVGLRIATTMTPLDQPRPNESSAGNPSRWRSRSAGPPYSSTSSAPANRSPVTASVFVGRRACFAIVLHHFSRASFDDGSPGGHVN